MGRARLRKNRQLARKICEALHLSPAALQASLRPYGVSRMHQVLRARQITLIYNLGVVQGLLTAPRLVGSIPAVESALVNPNDFDRRYPDIGPKRVG